MNKMQAEWKPCNAGALNHSTATDLFGGLVKPTDPFSGNCI